ncbi:MAG: hypothetical protein JO103_01455 [Candidatus Eremiobacteraeota bacterium]|nr:hypothetical protein [Candidatus Eremiobacteraeota bacterium]
MENRPMHRLLSSIALAAALATPAAALAADVTIDASLIPDGTYTVHVDKVVNAQHILVTMQGTMKTDLASGKADVTFTDKVKANDDLRIVLAKGKVLSFEAVKK